MPRSDQIPGSAATKSELRAWARRQRHAIPHDQRRVMDERIGQTLITVSQHMNLRILAAFLAFDSEPDLRPALQRLSSTGCRIALPVIRDAARRRLTFHYWRPGDRLRRNAFGIEEPADTPEVPLDDIDLVLMPLAAWDRFGNRLGMGGGYYDRLLASYRDKAKPVRAGVAYWNQCCGRLPSDPWDVSLHAVLTETGWLPLPVPEDDNNPAAPASE